MKMKIGSFKVNYSFRPARMICDIISLLMAAFSVFSAASFTSLHPEIKLEMVRVDLITLWTFPALCVITLAVYVILTLKSRRFAKYAITRENAQSVFDWYAFAVSLCKLPVLISVIEAMFIFQERLLGFEKSFFSITFILCALVFIIIIRLSKHRITSLTKTQKKNGGAVFVKSSVDDKNDNEREK